MKNCSLKGIARSAIASIPESLLECVSDKSGRLGVLWSMTRTQRSDHIRGKRSHVATPCTLRT